MGSNPADKCTYFKTANHDIYPLPLATLIYAVSCMAICQNIQQLLQYSFIVQLLHLTI